MTRNRIIKPILLTLAVAVFFSSCARGNPHHSGKATELSYGFTTEPSTFDPLNPANTADGRSILFNVFEGLVKPDSSGSLLPCIAESWEIGQDGLVYDFTLRENVFFHDGSTVSSADVKFSLDTAVTAGLNGLSIIKETEIINDNRVRITLKSPDPEFLPYLTIAVVKAGNNEREKNITGTGPFFIESYSIQQNLVLRKFSNYWQKDLPYLEKVTIVFFANNDSLMLAFRGGSIDAASITGSMAAQLDRGNFDIITNYSASVQLMALNNAAPPFNDVRVRRAVNHAVDAQGIINAAFFGVGEPSASPIIPGLTHFYDDSIQYQYDPSIARQLLAQAGFSDELKLSLEITVPSNYTQHVDTAQVIVNQLAGCGIDASIKLVDWATWLSDVYRGRNYQATVVSLDSHIISPRGFLGRYRTGNSGNFMNFSSAEFDRIYEAVLAETDEAQRVRLYRQAQRVIVSEAAGVYIQDILYYKAFRGGAFDGVINYPLYTIDFAAIYGKQKN